MPHLRRTTPQRAPVMPSGASSPCSSRCRPAHPETMARELDLPLGVVGRELVLMEHRGLVARFADGGRVLTERGATIVATLF